MSLIKLLEARRSLPPPERRREIRVSAGVTLRQMASELGVSNPTVLAWETGRFEPSNKFVVPYAELLAGIEAITDGAQ